MMKRVTGIGGIFFKCQDPDKVKKWYADHLGLPVDQWGCSFQWYPDKTSETPAITQWSPFKKDTDYFAPSQREFMINYRVENLPELLKILREEGVTIVGEMQEFSYGKFAWIVDPEGNKIELWEPKDDGF